MPGAITSYCTSSPGMFGESTATGTGEPSERGYLGKMSLPPAGFEGRTPDEIYRAAQVWSHLEMLSIANGVCPRCSATLEHEVLACDAHDAVGELCEVCGNRQPLMMQTRCTYCIFRGKGAIGNLLYGHHAVQAYKVGHGENFVAPSGGRNPLSDQEQTVLSVDPLSARVTYRFEGETLTMAIDDDLNILEVTE